jgi:hypothetical protein
MNKLIQIYTLSDPVTLEIRYIGKTVVPLKYRLSSHICESKKYNNSYKNSWIRSLLIKNQSPIIELLDTYDKKDWEWVEQYWISQFKTWGFKLVNLTDGGDGNKNQYFSLETYKKRKETIQRKIKSGEITYKERALKISKALKGKKVSIKTREKLRQINLGKKYSLETILKKSKGGVLKLSKNNIIIEEYITLTEAALKNNLSKGNISNACTGRVKTCGGFKWKYKE